MDIVKAEILKLLDVGVIYPITDGKWGTNPCGAQKDRNHVGKE
jgi:hypothetical protein